MAGLDADWKSLNLSTETQNAIKRFGFQSMTPVQLATIPLLSKNRDVIVEAVTGSGKTLAFLIPILEKLHQLKDSKLHNHFNALVIAPTRELAVQIKNVWDKLCSPSDSSEQNISIEAQLVIGGQSTVQIDLDLFVKLQPHLIIGTPGRVSDLLAKSSTISCKAVEILILDEADHLLDLGFQNTLQSIINLLPKQRRTGLFSATMNDAIKSFLCIAGLRNTARITVKAKAKESKETVSSENNEQRVPTNLSNYYTIVKPSDRFSHLLYLIENCDFKNMIIFFSNCACVEYFSNIFSSIPLLSSNCNVIDLHGKQSVNRRQKSFNRFNTNSKEKQILLTTDVAARGLDFESVDVVVQYDPPVDPKAFSHRSGRAARAGKDGYSIILLNEGREEQFVELVEVRGIPLEPWKGMQTTFEHNEKTANINAKIRKVLKKERELYLKGMKAFVSHIQSYRKHQANYIFRIKDLDFGGVAESMALLHLPTMPELKSAKSSQLENFKGDEFVDKSRIPYANKIKEKDRKRKLNEVTLSVPKKKAQVKSTSSEKTAWSEKKGLKIKRSERKKKLNDKIDVKVGKEKDNDDDEELMQDWKDFVMEKKQKKKTSNNYNN